MWRSTTIKGVYVVETPVFVVFHHNMDVVDVFVRESVWGGKSMDRCMDRWGMDR